MQGAAIMVQGTASSVGKSLMVTAFCRMLRREGVRVAPFKAQNMALNAAVTPDGAEIGRAQMVQADAAGVIACADMNPVLLKPEGDRRSQVVVMGKAVGSMSAAEYHAHKPMLRRTIAESLERLREAYDVVVIEGAGSPAEINLRDRDIVNMFVARTAKAPVLLVGDIDRGGVFASFVGTLELLEPEDRARVAALVVNKFRGDVSLLQPGLDFITARTGVPVLGVVPYVPKLRIADEDSLSLQHRVRREPVAGSLDVVVVRLPRLSNHDDVEALEHEPDVVVRFAEHAAQLRGADLVILPGSKNTIRDLAWLRETGIADVVLQRAAAGAPVLGICGGCQMLGLRIDDPLGVESPEGSAEGLALLPFSTLFERTKVCAQVQALAAQPSWLHDGDPQPLTGYEIHMGSLKPTEAAQVPFTITARNGQAVRLADGAIDASGAVIGTMVHGILDNDSVRHRLLAQLWSRRGEAPPARAPIPGRLAEYDRLADAFSGSIDRPLLDRLLQPLAL